jgi:3-oxoacyl-(acyl-carrier-protein) synthase
LGIGGHDFVAAVLSTHQSAIDRITSFSTDGLPCHLGAIVPDQYLPETDDTRRWSRLSRMTVTACREAVADATLQASATLPQCGLVVGTEFGDLRSTEAFTLGFLRRGPLGLSPLLFPNTVMNAMAGTTGIALGLKGPMLTLNQPGIAGEVAVARAVMLLRAGRAPAVIVCGVDELFPMLYETLTALKIPSPCQGGKEACRPFDRRHNGPVLGEGATAVVLESPAHARARGAPILAEIYSATWGALPARPSHYPARHQIHGRLLDRALAEAGLQSHEVRVAYLSAAGQPQHDAAELAALVASFGPGSPLVTSVTHLMGEHSGLGAFRLAAATTTITHAVIPSLTYLCQPIRPDVPFATPDHLPVSRGAVLVHGLARGGTQVALIVGPPGENAPQRRRVIP